jgi:hypothetical protein
LLSPDHRYHRIVRSRPLSRSGALLLLAVFLATGGLRALDAAVYHQSGGVSPAGQSRIYGTESPKAHTDQCVLGVELRSPSEAAFAPEIPAVRSTSPCAPSPARVSAPRSTRLSGTLARAPPHLA